MLKEVAKMSLLLATSVVAVPYALAFTAHMLYGWPTGPNKYRRALAPRKVLALNYVILQQLSNIRFAKLYFRWRRFYREAMVMRLLKDIPFGSNNNELDLYFPKSDTTERSSHPVVVFVFGGAWGSGDKSMYGLLGAEIADNLQAIVCIPNYSLHPRGYVDDMVQDVVDCLAWVHANIDKYGGDKHSIMLMGHSSGAHLAVMGAVELTLKRLLHNPQAIIRAEGDVTPPPESLTESLAGSTLLLSSMFRSQPSNSAVGSIKFEDRHFDRSSQSGSEGSDQNGAAAPKPQVLAPENTTGSFCIVGNGEKDPSAASGGAESFFMVQQGAEDAEGNGSSNGKSLEILEVSELDEEREMSDNRQDEATRARSEDTSTNEETEAERKVEASEMKSDADTIGLKESHGESGMKHELVIEDDDTMTRSQREVRDILSCIHCIVGFAGVYDIVDHYDHERMRGVEDLSPMHKAMYGPEHFHRFSPTQIIATLPHRTRFPPVLLVHGDGDYIVPTSSSEKFSAAVSEMGSQVIEYRLPGCGHHDVCFDLMDKDRTYYKPIMRILSQAAEAYL